MNRLVLLFLPVMLLLVSETFSQVVTPRQKNDSTQIVNLIHADKFGYQKIDSVNELQTLVGNVKLEQEGTYFDADSVVIRNGKVIEAFGNVHINDKDSVHTYSQYLLYYVDPKLATLRNKVKLTDGKTTLTTDELQYDVNMRIGEYHNGGKLINKGSVLTSKDGKYYSELKEAYFSHDVKLDDPQYKLQSDSLVYNTETELTTFVAPTFIKDTANRTIETSDGYYDLKNKRAFFGKRPKINDGPVFVTADQINTNDSTHLSVLTGNAVYTDTAQGVSVLANYIITNREKNTFLATKKPLMIIKQENDSIYIAADTLYSGLMKELKAADTLSAGDSTKRLPLDSTVVVSTNDTSQKVTDTTRYFQAYHHVRIFSDSMQAVSDSLIYLGSDSVFRLFINPILWSGNNQVTGDTIYLYTKNKKPDRVEVFENGFAVEKAGIDMYNQLRGNRLFAYFEDGNINFMRAKGNAESIYYVLDNDSAIVGVNKVIGDIIELRFLNKELHRVVVIGQPTGTMVPVLKASEQDKYLRDFKWLEGRRPKTKFELFEN